MIAKHAYNLLPTMRSWAVAFHFRPLAVEPMRGSPGVAVSLDLEAYDRRRAVMLALVKVAAGAAPFSAWLPHAEAIARSKSEKFDLHLKVLYELLRDLEPLAARVSFAWIRRAVAKVDELAGLLRRNIQKSIALDALIVALRPE